jgi:hypothetical protein
MISDYEGREETARDSRYFKAPKGWLSFFGEMYSTIEGHLVEDLIAIRSATIMKLSGGLILRFDGSRVDYGQSVELGKGEQVESSCRKNIEFEECSLEFLKSIAIGKRITSAGDFGNYVEFGLDQRFNLGLHRDGFNIISTENPIKDHRL